MASWCAHGVQYADTSAWSTLRPANESRSSAHHTPQQHWSVAAEVALMMTETSGLTCARDPRHSSTMYNIYLQAVRGLAPCVATACETRRPQVASLQACSLCAALRDLRRLLLPNLMSSSFKNVKPCFRPVPDLPGERILRARLQQASR